jgi:hypothetical protein
LRINCAIARSRFPTLALRLVKKRAGARGRITESTMDAAVIWPRAGRDGAPPAQGMEWSSRMLALIGRIKETGTMSEHRPLQVGAVDPELKTSPILDEDEENLLELGHESGACLFNGVSYAIGEYVLSGNELLHCEERGLWVRKGEIRTD